MVRTHGVVVHIVKTEATRLETWNAKFTALRRREQLLSKSRFEFMINVSKQRVQSGFGFDNVSRQGRTRYQKSG
jgi:hypothetical protein